MSVRVLDASLAAIFLQRHPEIRADEIPSYGIHVTDDFEGAPRDYLVGLNHNTGEVKVIDITAYQDGVRIDPATAGQVDWAAFLRDTFDPFTAGSLTNIVLVAALVIGGIWLWKSLPSSKDF